MTYHLWILDTKRENLSIQMNGSGPRTWKDHQGPWGWAKKHLEYGTYKTFKCECATPCVQGPRYGF